MCKLGSKVFFTGLETGMGGLCLGTVESKSACLVLNIKTPFGVDKELAIVTLTMETSLSWRSPMKNVLIGVKGDIAFSSR